MVNQPTSDVKKPLGEPEEVFGEEMRDLSPEEMDKVIGGGPYTGNQFPPGGKGCNAQDNQGYGFM